MRHRFLGKTFLTAAFAVLVAVPGVVTCPPAAAAAVPPPTVGACSDMTTPEENHASIRLRIDEPADGAEAAVDENGRIAISGVLHKQATMIDVSDERVVATDIAIGEPPEDVAAWASGWTTSLRPPHLGPNQVCARAERDPKRSARVLRSFTVVDRIPPSNVTGLSVSEITPYSARVSWGAATDNYGLAGYDVSVDGGTPRRTTAGTRTYRITGLAPFTNHTVSVVAVDLAGNRSPTPATASFQTEVEPPPPSGDLTFAPQDGGATASWHTYLPSDPGVRDVSYRAYLDNQLVEEFPLDTYCAAELCSFVIEPLEAGTPYTFRVDAIRPDGEVGRSLNGTFRTTAVERSVSPEITQMNASESTRCAAGGGDFYLSTDVRGSVQIPEGSSQVFDGCYRAPDSSCIDDFLPPTDDAEVAECEDDVTRTLYASAPPGRGPVISSIDDLPSTASEPRLLLAGPVAPVAWCLSSGACTILLAPAAQAAEATAVAAGAGALGSFLVVAAAGIGIGIVLGLLLAILFPSPIGIGGILEYPIDPDTDFDTFDNWGADEGEWYNSLKVYAEVIKTTKLITERDNLQFAWGNLDDALLKRTIDRACTAQQGGTGAAAGCDEDFAVYVPGARNYKLADMSQTAGHIVAAMGDGFPQPPTRMQWYWPARSVNGQKARDAGYNRNWFDTDVKFQPNICNTRPRGQVCDEFPFWTTNQAVDLSGMVASLKPVPGAESLPQATDIIGFHNKCRVDDNEHFIVLPLKPWVQANGPSFGFRVSAGGASVCMSPAQP
nr:fibronectin type III domain-containing protein [Actinoplanes aureus]